MNSTTSLAQLKHALETQGLHAALEILNARVPHRHSFIYRLSGDSFHAISMVDKQGEQIPPILERIPFERSYCQYSVGVGQFRVTDSTHDNRLNGNVFQETVQSYIGLPLTSSQGGVWGSFCHLDSAPQTITDNEFEFLKQATKLLAQFAPREVQGKSNK